MFSKLFGIHESSLGKQVRANVLSIKVISLLATLRSSYMVSFLYFGVRPSILNLQAQFHQHDVSKSV